jgi:hypothetical protein
MVQLGNQQHLSRLVGFNLVLPCSGAKGGFGGIRQYCGVKRTLQDRDVSQGCDQASVRRRAP